MKNEKNLIPNFQKSRISRAQRPGIIANDSSLRGFTFIDVIVGIALMAIVFLGIFAAYQLGLKVVGQSKNKITATAIANATLEKIRNLSYEKVGTIGASPSPPYAVGILEPATTTTLNNVEYNISLTVKYIADETDGLASPDDDCPLDYKRVEVKVSWSGRFSGKVTLFTDVAPKNLSQECEKSGGILSVTVFDAYGNRVPSPLIEIKNPETGNLIDSVTPPDGTHNFPLATSTYKVVVSKSGYSREETFGTGDTYQGENIAIPEKPHPIVLDGQLTEISFSIDRLSNFSVNTLSLWGTDSFFDSFLDSTKISQSSNIVVKGGEVNLTTTTEGYLSSGYLISTAISPSNLLKWDEFSFSDLEPENTDLKYQIYYASGTDWYLIPNSDLPGNSTGFDFSPVDLSNLSTSTYSQLKLRGNLSTNTTTSSPTLKDWQVSWITNLPTPIPNVTFLLQGTKLVGRDTEEKPIYKYWATSTSDAKGNVNITALEWDNYTFSATGTLDLVGTNPSPQPIGLAPNSTQSVDLYFKAENSLLLTIRDSETLEPIFAASSTLSNFSLGYSKTQYTNEDGQTYFIPLEPGHYNLDVSASGYLATSTTVWVFKDLTKTLKLQRIE